MQDIENNMDKLLRKAAYNYGLKEPANDWDKIASQLDTSIAPVSPKRKYLKRYGTGALLLLALVITGSIMYWNYTNDAQENKIPIAQKTFSNPEEITSNEINNNTSKNDLMSKKGNLKTVVNDNSGYKFIISKKVSAEQKMKNTNNLFSLNAAKNGKDQFADLTKTNNNTDLGKIQQEQVSASNENLEAQKNESFSNNPVQIKLQNKKVKGIYAGLLAGIALNSVKYQQVNVPGVDVGLRIGYRFNNHISIESGLLFGTKKYYTDGKYFNMEKVGPTMPSDMQVVNVTSRTNMFEIPLNVKYDLTNKPKNNFFVSAGVSSFILTSEKNDYLMQHDNVKETMTGSYNNKSGYFAGAVNLSAGYQFTTKKNTSISIEPYTQIPLTGIGVGKLPVASTGLRVGFIFSSRK